MASFFNQKRTMEIDRLSFETLKLVVDLEALRSLAQQGFRSGAPIPMNTTESVFSWLDDAVFGDKRISFYSDRIGHSYEDFVSHCQKLSHETSTLYSGNGQNCLVPNQYDLTGSQKSELQDKMQTLAKKALVSAENLWAAAETELK